MTNEELTAILQKRFEENNHRHPALEWSGIEARIAADSRAAEVLREMEATGGEPDVLQFDPDKETYLFVDFARETPKGRRSVCYDDTALEARKKYKPKTSALTQAEQIGIQLLDEDLYRQLQEVEPVDMKTSSWILTPQPIREKGGALFGDRRYDQVFIYHNGADSYFGARGFRGFIEI
ncbi:DUF4256 domain-containing protein [Alkalicoccus urumqiensis]|nr:DUF4256 domain-containing protein [Alkalicoccus urumqiensis]